MTRKEWIEKNLPAYVNNNADERYEPSRTIEELNTAVFHLKAQHLTDELVRKIFDEEPKENKQWTL